MVTVTVQSHPAQRVSAPLEGGKRDGRIPSHGPAAAPLSTRRRRAVRGKES